MTTPIDIPALRSIMATLEHARSNGHRAIVVVYEAKLSEMLLEQAPALLDEVARLRAVVRRTHETHCDEEWTSRRLHAPECLLYELD